MPLGVESDDHELLLAMAHGLEGLDILYARYRTLAFSVAQRITGHAPLAEEVAQDAFLGAWRNAHRYDPSRSSVRTWLMAIVHHRAIDAIRRRKPTSELPDVEVGLPVSSLTVDPWAEVSARLDADDVRRVLGVLTEVQRRSIELAFFAGLTQQEIADLTGTPLGTVKSRIRLGLLTMRRAMVRESRAATS